MIYQYIYIVSSKIINIRKSEAKIVKTEVNDDILLNKIINNLIGKWNSDISGLSNWALFKSPAGKQILRKCSWMMLLSEQWWMEHHKLFTCLQCVHYQHEQVVKLLLIKNTTFV